MAKLFMSILNFEMVFDIISHFNHSINFFYFDLFVQKASRSTHLVIIDFKKETFFRYLIIFIVIYL